MTPRLLCVALAALTAGGISVAVPAAGTQATAPQPASRAPRDAAEFDAMFQQVKNWGRWGADDQLGSANLVTVAKRKQAVALAKTGETVSLAHNPLTEKAEDNGSPFEQTMLRGNNMDRYAVSYHGYAHSHIDALCHILYKDQTYNGYARAEVNTDKGCTKLGIQNLKNGIVTRGILVDIPRLRHVPYLEPGTAIYVEDLEAWEKQAGVKIASGDALIVRTGRWARREKIGPWNVGQSAAGLHASVAPWIKRRGAGRHAVARGRCRPSDPHADDHGAWHQPARQSGSRSARRDGGAAESLGVHAHDRAGPGHGRHRVPVERDRDVLMSRGTAEAVPYVRLDASST
jgi:Putative cyclase